MSRDRQISTWPFVVVLAALFTLSVAAPRSWEKIAGRDEHHVAFRSAKVRSLAERKATRPLVAPAPADPGLVPDGSDQDPAGATYQDHQPAVRDLTEIHPKIARQQLPTLPLIDEPPAMVDLGAPATSLTAESGPAEEQSAGPLEGPALAKDQAPATEAEPAEPPPSAPSPTRQRRRARPRVAGAWGEHEALLTQLDQLAWDCRSGEWAARIADLVRELGRIADPNSPRALVALGRLRDLSERDHPLLAEVYDRPQAAVLRRVRFAVLRRLEVWEMVPEIALPRLGERKTVSLRQADQAPTRDAGQVARLLDHLERFEHTGLSDDGRELAADVARLSAGDGPSAARIHHWLEANYRNSNLRLVISADLLNRFVPKQPTLESPVRDRILGVPTRGWSSTTAELGVRLLPDARNVRLALEVRGLVLARTTSKSGPVTIYSHSDSTYLARKVFQLNAAGIETWPAEAAASHSPQLRGVETDYDDVPLLGLVVEGIARVKHAEKEGEVRRVARRKVITRVQEEIDAAVEPRLTEAKAAVRRRVLTPLDGLALEPMVIDLRTSDSRATMRFRLAADGQLAACTPRPMALTDSLASLQIHQSLLNNIGDRLGLDGQSFHLPELQQRLLEAFQLPPQAMSNEFPPDLRITFAKNDSLAVRFAEGRVELTLAVAELRKYPKSWRNFQVRVHYRPEVRGLDARFVRDGTVQLWGQRFGNQPQIALRGIFSKVFSHDRDLRLVDDRTLADPRLNGLGVTQCVVTDGWLGLSLGPARSSTARREVNQLH